MAGTGLDRPGHDENFSSNALGFSRRGDYNAETRTLSRKINDGLN